jgi:heme exporter protein C
MVNLSMIDKYANPNRFLRIARPLVPWIGAITLICLGIGLYLGLFISPADYQQGESVRIIYVHVPAAWMAMFCYTSLVISAAIGLIWKHPLADIAARETAPIGAIFTFLALLTGSFWGKPMWGTWWVWDARLTSMLVLFFLYIGYMALNNAFDSPKRGARASAILALVGFINIPIIKFSVDWWNTLHQPASVMRLDGPTIHSSMLTPLLIMAVGYSFFFLWVLIIRMDGQITAGKIQSLRQRSAQQSLQQQPITSSEA